MATAADGTAYAARERTRVLVYDRNSALRQTVCDYVNSQPDLTTCGAARVPELVLLGTASFAPDVIVLGLSVGHPEDLDLVADIHSANPGPRVLVLALTDHHPDAHDAREAGAQGFVGKDDVPDTLLSGIRSLARGRAHGLPVT
jgi:DNA-binding NarL/FixJ family response regulator